MKKSNTKANGKTVRLDDIKDLIFGVATIVDKCTCLSRVLQYMTRDLVPGGSCPYDNAFVEMMDNLTEELSMINDQLSEFMEYKWGIEKVGEALLEWSDSKNVASLRSCIRRGDFKVT